jgi:hypothetical protein
MPANALVPVIGLAQAQRVPTYGAGVEVDTTALEALLGEIRRTVAHVNWLEAYVAELPEWAAFADVEREWSSESEAYTAKPAPDSLKYIIAAERQKRLNGGRMRQGTHPAIKQLLSERQHLVQTCAVAIKVGVALDAIEFAKSQGALVVDAMREFATSLGVDPQDAKIVDMMASALERVR